MMTDILFIVGSPREGSSLHAARHMIARAESQGMDCDLLHLNYNPPPCRACDRCKEGECYDEEVTRTNERLAKARAIVVCSPVYFGCMSAQLKALFDRTRPLRANGRLKDCIGAAVATGRSRNGGQEMTIQSIHAWMHIQGMVIAGDDSHFGGTLQEPASKDEYGIQTIDRTIHKVCRLIG